MQLFVWPPLCPSGYCLCVCVCVGGGGGGGGGVSQVPLLREWLWPST